jgi:cytochrome c-type biogenesis protein CcmH/NrfF
MRRTWLLWMLPWLAAVTRVVVVAWHMVNRLLVGTQQQQARRRAVTDHATTTGVQTARDWIYQQHHGTHTNKDAAD